MGAIGGGWSLPTHLDGAVMADQQLVPADVQDRAFAVCERIAFGDTLDEAASQPGLPTREQFLGWVMRYSELNLLYSKAREVSAFALEDEALAKLKALCKEPGSPQKVSAFKALVEQMRWSAAKRNPQVFSDKAAMNVVVPIQITTSLDMGGGSSIGTKEFPNIYDMKAAVTQEVAVADIPNAVIEEIAAAPGPFLGLTSAVLARQKAGAGEAEEQGEEADAPGVEAVAKRAEEERDARAEARAVAQRSRRLPGNTPRRGEQQAPRASGDAEVERPKESGT